MAFSVSVMTDRIQLSNGSFVLVDAEDYEFLNQWKWKEHSGTAQRNKHIATIGDWKDGKRKDVCVLMHRVIMDAPEGMDVDHINGNRLDNRRANLRVCSHAQNRANSKTPVTNKSGYKGVSWCKRDSRWIAFITSNGKSKNLGRFLDIVEAAKAYNRAALSMFGEYARLNEIGEI